MRGEQVIRGADARDITTRHNNLRHEERSEDCGGSEPDICALESKAQIQDRVQNKNWAEICPITGATS